MENKRSVEIRKHHLEDILKQVANGQPDSLPAYVPKGIRDGNSELVQSLIDGCTLVVTENKPDKICLGCKLIKSCNFRD